MKENMRLKRSTADALTLSFLEHDIEAMTKEYLLWMGEGAQRIIPTLAYPNKWRTMHRQITVINNDIKNKNYFIAEDGVHLKEDYDITKERREYLKYIIIRILAPAIKSKKAWEIVFGRYIDQTAYTPQEHTELNAFVLCLEKIFSSKTIPKDPEFLHFPSELKLYLAYLREYYHPLRDILTEFWHRNLKAGDSLTDFFRKYKKTETLNTFRSLPFPAWFEIKGDDIILNPMSKENFLFLLSGVMTREFINKKHAWVFYVNTYFNFYNTQYEKIKESHSIIE